MSKIHASEELIQKTLKRIEQEKQKTKTTKKKKNTAKIISIGGTAMAAAAAVIVCLNLGQMKESNLTINQIDQVEVRTETSGLFMPMGEAAAEKMTEEEFNDYLGLDCENLFETAEFEKSVLKDEKGTFYYGARDIQITVKLSKSEDLTPETMRDLEESDLGGHKICLAKDESNYYAAGSEKNINFYIVAKCSNDKAFEDLMKDFLKNF